MEGLLDIILGFFQVERKQLNFCETTSNLQRMDFVAKRFCCETTESRKSIVIYSILNFIINFVLLRYG